MAKKAVFMDRDGVINKVCYHHELGIYSAKNMDEFKVIDGVKEGIAKIKIMNFLSIVVSNQPGFAFGYLKEHEVEEINAFMKKELGIDRVYMCIHHPDHSGECDCRKPKSGMLTQASKDLNIDLGQSYMVGDNISDILAGKDCKKRIFIGRARCDLCNLFLEHNAQPDHIVPNLYHAALQIEELEKEF